MLLKIILLSFGAFHSLALPFEKNDTIDSILPVEKSSAKKGDPSYLLPDNAILPENYKLTIDVSHSFIEIEKREFFGEIEILATVNKNSLTEIVLHSVNNEIIGDIRVNGEVATFSFDEQREFLKITPATSLTYGLQIIISISYKGKLNDNMKGFYVSTYNENNNKIYILTTQFQPTQARKAFPCFDEPKYKATFELTFKKEAQYLVTSNMNPIEPDYGRGSNTVSFPVTPKMSTYLVAFIVSQYKYKESPFDNTFKIWTRPNAINQTQWSANYVYNITNNLDEYTGIKYNEYIPKMDMASITDFSAGAMENWGMLTYRESALLTDEEFSTNRNYQGVITVIAHEIAHQWFGDIVTCHWWKNTWLNEGFATYFEYHTTGNVFPEWEMKDQFIVDAMQSILGLDGLESTTPITLDVYTPQEISNHFGSITYSKAGSVIRMMEHIVGSDIFQQGLQNYLNINRLKYTEPEDLFSAIQEVIDEQNVPLEYSLSTIMSNWISQPGYPVINVTSVAPGIIALSQQRFILRPLRPYGKSKSEETWFVPISYTTSKDLEFDNLQPTLWLTPNEPRKLIEVDNDADFIIVNLQEAGYYRVNYEPVIWQRIAETLATKGSSVHHINKAQIIDDVMNLALANLVDYDTAFKVTDFLAFETGFYPWTAAFSNFYSLMIMFPADHDTGMEIRRYLRELMQLLLEDKEFVEINESQIETFNRELALKWACDLGDEKYISQALNLFKNYKENDARIPRNLRSIVYCNALRYGSEDDRNFLWNKYNTSNNEAEKNTIINGLFCSMSNNILKSYLEKSIRPESGIRKQDASYVFEAVYSGSSNGLEVAFDFLAENYIKIAEYYGDMNVLRKAVLGLAARMTDKSRIEKFIKLLYSTDIFTTYRDTAEETMRNNIAWIEKYSEIIKNILIQKRTKKNHE